jgi:hypothetical protein
MKAYAFAAIAAISAASLVGCSPSTNTLDPSVASAITTAYNDMCGPTGVVVSAEPFSAANPNIAKYLSEAQAICANGAPTNEVVAGFDIFDVYLDLSQALSAKGAVAPSVVKKAKALKLSAHHA